MKTTPHTIFVYSGGSYLRVVRGEHNLPETTIKPRRYDNLIEAMHGERKRPRILNLLNQFPTDKHLDKRLKALKAPVSVASHKSLIECIRSSVFLYAQVGFNSDSKEIAYVYHRSKATETGLAMVKSGPVATVRKLLRKYKKPPLRELNYPARKPKVAAVGEAA